MLVKGQLSERAAGRPVLALPPQSALLASAPLQQGCAAHPGNLPRNMPDNMPRNMPGNMPDDAPEPPSQRQRVTRLLIVLLLLGVLVLVIVDHVVMPCKVSQNATTNCTDSPPDDCRAEKACSSVLLEAFIDWVADEPAAGAVLLAVVYVVATVCLVPGSILTLGAGAAFSSALGLGWGVVVGTIAVWVGAAVGSLLAFVLGRFALHRMVHRLLQVRARARPRARL